MTGLSVERYPHIALKIVKRGHEAAAHGRRWARSRPAPGLNMVREAATANALREADRHRRALSCQLLANGNRRHD
jgi:peptidoglycan/xylan/chitin deacetylase (PgdA/CDA1 family)